MISLILSICALILGYFLYGTLMAKIFRHDGRPTPAYSKQDGTDYVPMPTWKVFMIQLLNIAGTGPIFGAIMGAMFGPSSFLWIVFGCIFAGAVHDYLSGMLSVRLGGASLPEIVGEYLGRGTRNVMLVFSVIMLLLVGAVFVFSPASILGGMARFGIEKPAEGLDWAVMIWVGIIFVYYLVATCVPIDKLIGKIYPVFAVALIFMALSLLVCLFVKWPHIPEIWDMFTSDKGGFDLGGRESLNFSGKPIFPCLFITIACGAISGFHATQSPMMARCLKNEKLGKPIFYGSMITEGAIALVWAAVASWFIYDGGAETLGLATTASAPVIVNAVSKSWLGVFGGILAILGVVAAPVTSGDTALRSARLIIADAFKLDQKPVAMRFAVSIPIFVVTALLLWYEIGNPAGFNTIWNYFGWANQTLSVFTLWAITVFLAARPFADESFWKYSFILTLIPATFMTAVCSSFILTAGSTIGVGFNLPALWAPNLAIVAALFSLVVFCLWYFRRAPKAKHLKNYKK